LKTKEELIEIAKEIEGRLDIILTNHAILVDRLQALNHILTLSEVCISLMTNNIKSIGESAREVVEAIDQIESE
jgi:hypothetical protein